MAACGRTEAEFYELPSGQWGALDMHFAENISFEDLPDVFLSDWVVVHEKEQVLELAEDTNKEGLLRYIAGKSEKGERILMLAPRESHGNGDNLFTYLCGLLNYQDVGIDEERHDSRKQVQLFLQDPLQYVKKAFATCPYPWKLQNLGLYESDIKTEAMNMAEHLKKRLPSSPQRCYQFLAYDGGHRFGDFVRDDVYTFEGRTVRGHMLVHHMDDDYAVLAFGYQDYEPKEDEAVLWMGPEVPEALLEDPHAFVHERWLEWCQLFDPQAHPGNKGLLQAVADPETYIVTDDVPPRADAGRPCCPEYTSFPRLDWKISSVEMSDEFFEDVGGLYNRWLMRGKDEGGRSYVWGYIAPCDRPEDDSEEAVLAFGRRFLSGVFTHFRIENLKADVGSHYEVTADTVQLDFALKDGGDAGAFCRLTLDRKTGIFTLRINREMQKAMEFAWHDLYDVRYWYTAARANG